MEVRTNLENETEKNIELSAELLTLVNQKDILSSQLAESQGLERSLKKSNDELLQEALRLREENADLKSNFVIAQDELVRVRQNAMLAEMEVKRAVLEKEQAKLEYERGANEILRDADVRRSPSPVRHEASSTAPVSSTFGEELANLASYKWALQHAENKVSELKAENEALSQRLLDATNGSDKFATALRRESEEALNKKLADMEKSFAEKFKRDLQAHEVHAHKKQETATTVLKQHISILETENKKMREALLRRVGGDSPVRMPQNTHPGVLNNSATVEKSANHDALQSIDYEDQLEAEKSKNRALRQRLTDLEVNARGIILGELNEVENRNSALTARNALLEEELKQYRSYMKDTVGKYKSQVYFFMRVTIGHVILCVGFYRIAVLDTQLAYTASRNIWRRRWSAIK